MPQQTMFIEDSSGKIVARLENEPNPEEEYPSRRSSSSKSVKSYLDTEATEDGGEYICFFQPFFSCSLVILIKTTHTRLFYVT